MPRAHGPLRCNGSPLARGDDFDCRCFHFGGVGSRANACLRSSAHRMLPTRRCASTPHYGCTSGLQSRRQSHRAYACSCKLKHDFARIDSVGFRRRLAHWRQQPGQGLARHEQFMTQIALRLCAQTRIVSKARIRLDSGNLCDLSTE